MPQVDDLSRSLVAFDQDATLIVVVEMSEASWLVAGMAPGALSRSRILLVNPAAHSKTALRKINHLEPSTWARNPPKMAYSWRV